MQEILLSSFCLCCYPSHSTPFWVSYKDKRLLLAQFWSKIEYLHLGVVFLLSISKCHRVSHSQRQGAYKFVCYKQPIYSWVCVLVSVLLL